MNTRRAAADPAAEPTPAPPSERVVLLQVLGESAVALQAAGAALGVAVALLEQAAPLTPAPPVGARPAYDPASASFGRG